MAGKPQISCKPPVETLGFIFDKTFGASGGRRRLLQRPVNLHAVA